MITIKTSMGEIEIELFEKEAPLTTRNFLNYIEAGHYNGTIFHRVIDGFMIQGGGLDTNFRELPTMPPIRNEAENGLKNDRGTIAMARTQVVDSATAQFFINVSDNHFLNHRDNSPQGFGYCVFGKVTTGMDIIDKIKSVSTGNKGIHQDVPVQNVIITEIVKT